MYTNKKGKSKTKTLTRNIIDHTYGKNKEKQSHRTVIYNQYDTQHSGMYKDGISIKNGLLTETGKI